MCKLTAHPLLALTLTLALVSTARTQPRVAPRDQFLEPHQLMQRQYDNWLEGQRLATGYYRYELADGAYPGGIFYRNPAAPAVRVFDYLHPFVPPTADLRSARVGDRYGLRLVRPRPGYGPPAERVSASAPSGAGYGLYTGGR
jgi:hypothetical protein